MEEDKNIDKVEKLERIAGEKIKSLINWIRTERFSNFLSVTLKVFGIILIAKVYYSLNAINSTFLHEGPSCSSNESSFQYWLSKKNKKAIIISINSSRFQTSNGTSTCHGYYKTEGSERYLKWEGSISDTSEGVVGNISI